MSIKNVAQLMTIKDQLSKAISLCLDVDLNSGSVDIRIPDWTEAPEGQMGAHVYKPQPDVLTVSFTPPAQYNQVNPQNRRNISVQYQDNANPGRPTHPFHQIQSGHQTVYQQGFVGPVFIAEVNTDPDTRDQRVEAIVDSVFIGILLQIGSPVQSSEKIELAGLSYTADDKVFDITVINTDGETLFAYLCKRSQSGQYATTPMTAFSQAVAIALVCNEENHDIPLHQLWQAHIHQFQGHRALTEYQASPVFQQHQYLGQQLNAQFNQQWDPAVGGYQSGYMPDPTQ